MRMIEAFKEGCDVGVKAITSGRLKKDKIVYKRLKKFDRKMKRKL